MTLVASQEELREALEARETDIQVNGNFTISNRWNVGSAAVISGAEGGRYTLSKADCYDGAQESHFAGNGSARVQVSYGTLILDTGTALQNNRADQGGGIFASDNADLPVTVRLQGNAAIRNNRALEYGGGIYVNYQSPESSLELSGQALVEGNTAGESGGGIYDRTTGAHSTLAINGNARITGNTAPSSGGGVYAVNCDFTLGGQADISDNNGAYEGGGIYWVGCRSLMESGSIIAYNRDVSAYGGLYLNPTEPFDIAIHGMFLSNYAGTAGGMCLSAGAAGTLDLSNAKFMENTVNTSGGGCVIRSAAPGYPPVTVIMKDADFSFNEAAYSGGGLYITLSSGSTVRPDDCAFGENTGGQGGGIYLIHDGPGESTFVMEAVTFISNTAYREGGGIALGPGGISVSLDQATLLNNSAATGGGRRRLPRPDHGI